MDNKIAALLDRAPVVPFGEGVGIPWGDPVFSARALEEHLCQAHDRASRRFEVIDRQVAWLQQVLLADRGGVVLDLGCGPGLYTSRLAKLGHRCVGVDLSPASIEYAREQVEREGLACRYELGDLGSVALPPGNNLALMLFGEFNMFSPSVASGLLRRVQGCLAPSGSLLLEVHPYETVRDIGEAPPHWALEEQGVFSDAPHLLLTESDWHAGQRVATERFTVIRDGAPTRSYSQTTQAYSDEELEEMLSEAGFSVAGWYESWGVTSEEDAQLLTLLAECGPG